MECYPKALKKHSKVSPKSFRPKLRFMKSVPDGEEPTVEHKPDLEPRVFGQGQEGGGASEGMACQRD
jgi:hypothetical protein